MGFGEEEAVRGGVLTPAAMAAADARTIAAGTPRNVLVARAAAACLRVLRSRSPRRPVTLLCGPGQNGADGFAMAHQLLRLGWPTQVIAPLGLPDDESALAPALRPATAFDPQEGDIVIDALFGAGLNRPLSGDALTLVERLAASPAQVLAADLPSGVDGGSGRVLGAAAQANWTVTFHRPKPGHLFHPGRALCGELIVADIGIEGEAGDASAILCSREMIRELIKAPNGNLHKYQRGHVAVLGGAGLRGGAGRLAARTAAVSGAGAVTFFSPLSSAEFAGNAFDAVMVRPLEGAAGLEQELGPTYSALVAGPGLGRDERARALVAAALKRGLPTVLDADGLTLFEDDPQDLFKRAHDQTIFTPHEGEFARLFPGLEGSPLERAEAAANRSGATILLKGSATVIAAPGELPIISAYGPPSLATAGSGDCLAGLIGALLAQGLRPKTAAAAGAWLHAEGARRRGATMTADDLPAAIQEAVGAVFVSADDQS